MASPDRILLGLDDEQRACVTHQPGPLVIEAGAGSGKTRVLTHRAAYRAASGTANPTRTLILTFTRKAAIELQHRLYRLGIDEVDARTIHSLAFMLVEQYWGDRDLPRRHVTSNPLRLMETATAHLSGLPATSILLREAEWLSAHGKTASQYSDTARIQSAENAEAIQGALHAYEALKFKKRVLDLGDLLLELLNALNDKEYAAALRWRFAHIMVDEAQDLNRAQWLIVRNLVGSGDDLCMVGDVNQAIYGWNGAEARYLSEFENRFPQATRIELSRNYRSTPEVLAAGDRTIGRATPTPTVRAEGIGRVTLHSFSSDEKETRSVLQSIRSEHARGVGYSGMAVLARTHATLAHVEASLRRAGIPVRTGRSLLHEPIVREALQELHQSRKSTPARSCVVDLREIVSDLVEQNRPSDQASNSSADHDYDVEKLEQLTILIEEWAAEGPYRTLAFLRDWLNTLVRHRGGDPGDAGPGVELATFHRAKGLEWRVVFVIGLEAGLVPLSHSNDQEEERRLLYVAQTRASERLFCSWAASRNGQVQRPSPWLDDIKETVTQEPSYDVVTASQRISEIRQLLKGA